MRKIFTGASDELGCMNGKAYEIVDEWRNYYSVIDESGEDYMAYIRRVSANPISRAVKLADLKHNMDLSRLPEITDADRERVEKYQRAMEILSANSER